MRIGLTGGIGSGKSTVAAMLVDHGAALIDTDAIARRLTGVEGGAMPALVATFGPSIAAGDGSLDRDRMRQIAFTDATARKRLEAVLHPMIGADAQRESEAAHAEMIVFDVPLLAESGVWRRRVQRVLVVDCSEAVQIERVSARPGWTAESARQAMTAQSTRAARRSIADAVIVNEAIDFATLRAEVGVLWSLWNNQR